MTTIDELQQAEMALFELGQKVAKLRQLSKPIPVKNYVFNDLEGDVTLLELFQGKQILFLIHNMGQGCRYCTLWADGLNGFLPHLESEFAIALVSKDDPQTQQAMANSRQWRFKLASHADGEYIQQQSVTPGENNTPGIICYVRDGEAIHRKNVAIFGPGDEFCSIWNILSLAGQSPNDWTPQYHYWKRPEQMDDGGENLL